MTEGKKQIQKCLSIESWQNFREEHSYLIPPRLIGQNDGFARAGLAEKADLIWSTGQNPCPVSLSGKVANLVGE